MSRHEIGEHEGLDDAGKANQYSRRDFLTTSSTVAAGLALGIDSAEAAPKSKKTSGSASGAKRPKTMLVKNATVVVTMDAGRREISDGGLYIEDGIIKQVGPTSSLPKTAEDVLDLKGHILLPGLVNTHHHLYQHLTRVVPAAQDGNVWNWLKVLYPMWARMQPDDVKLAIRVGLAELALSGCTTAFDHQYVFPNGCTLDDAIHTAAEVGVRFHASRGSMSLGASKGGLPPDSCVEEEAAILKDCRRVIETYHDDKPGAMTRIVLAPCSPFSVTDDLMVESAKMARQYKVNLHTHLAESPDEERFTLEKYKLRPAGLMEKFGWVGHDVWFAHSVHINDAEISMFAKTGCGVAHCPCSNMRLASGIAPVKKYRDAGVNVGLGVDGSSSNDGSHLLGEARQAMLLARLNLANTPGGPPTDKKQWLSARDALEIATLGGAAVLGRNDIGSLEPGKCADFFAVDLNRVGFAGGSMIDPVASLVFCAPVTADYTVINGRYIVKNGHITTLDLPNVLAQCNRASLKVVNG
jgi:cytosine/adenosine deaminase-related metal-dependent hydrolase